MNDDYRIFVIAAVCALIFIIGTIVMRLFNDAFPVVFTVHYIETFW